MKNVLIVNSSSHIGGAEKILLTFLNKIDNRLFNLSAVTPSEGKFTDLLRSRSIGVTVIDRLYNNNFVTRDDSLLSNPLVTASSISNLFRFSSALSRHIRQNDINLVLANGLKTAVAGGMAARFNKIESVWIIQDIFPENFFKKILNLCARLFSDRIIAISKAVKNQFPKSLHKKITVQYPFLGPDELIRAQKNSLLRQELDMKDDDIVCGAVSKIVPAKGLAIFLRTLAVVKINGRCPHLKAVIAGDAELEVARPGHLDELKSLAESLGLEKDVKFIGWRDDIYDVLNAIDILVHTSIRPEGFGRILIEAMAAAKPIVAFDQGAVREIMEDGVSGVLVEPLDETVLAQRLEDLIKDERKRKILGESARAHVEKYLAGDNATKENNFHL